jgi:predicted cupin superfamily sugar epimerase
MPDRIRQLISTLGLVPHPERGYFAETYRAVTRVGASSHDGERSASTAIYFLVTADQPVTSLGQDLEADERPQAVVPAGTWFGTELDPAASPCLVGCTVAPGFEYADFEMAEGPELEAEYPGAADRIRRMRRPRSSLAIVGG